MVPELEASSFGLVSHCSLFRETFALADNGRYTVDAAKHSKTYMAEIEKTLANACVIKYVGKNGVKLEDDLAQLSRCSANAVDYAQKWVEASGKDHVIFVLEGDNVEQSSPFVLAQLAHIKRLKEGNKYKVTVLVFKGIQEDGYSKAFVDGWLKELSELSVLAESYFAIVGTTKADEPLKADISYSLAGLVLNIGSGYKHEGFMYKLNREGEYEIGPEGFKVKTAGYRELCQMRDDPQMVEVMRLEDGPLPDGLAIFKHVDAGGQAAKGVGGRTPLTSLTSPSPSAPTSPSSARVSL